MRGCAAATLAGAMLWAGACKGDAPKPVAPAPQAPTSNPSRSEPIMGGGAAAPPEMRPAAPGGPVAPFVRQATIAASREGRRLIVYVGATWCEPCRRFKSALKRGELEGRGLAGVRLLEYDYDRDAQRLQPAGYKSRTIPLFAIPGPDGRASPQQLMGANKGAGAVDSIVTRLLTIMDI